MPSNDLALLVKAKIARENGDEEEELKILRQINDAAEKEKKEAEAKKKAEEEAKEKERLKEENRRKAESIQLFESMLSGVKEQLKQESDSRKKDMMVMQQMFKQTVDSVSENRQDIDVEAILDRMAQTIASSMERPVYEFEIERDNTMIAKKIIATPKRTLN